VPFIEPTAVMSISEHGSQKRLRRLDHMGKSHGPLSLLYRIELARDGFARCDAL
jgi:hypothetical protein